MKELDLKVGCALLTISFTFLICQTLFGFFLGKELSVINFLLIALLGPYALKFFRENKNVFPLKYHLTGGIVGFSISITAYFSLNFQA